MAIAYLGTNQIGGGGGGGSIDSIEMNGSAVPVTGGVADLGTVVTSVSDKAPLASPALTGTPTAPTAASGTNSTQIATTAFVQSAVSPTENAKSITYSDLKTARTNGTLVPGTWYRITDYVATTTDTESRSANHPFDIIVMAESGNKLLEEGYAALHSGDTYFANNNLAAWKVWYSIDNDTTRFAWADTTNGKGVVYRLIDEYNNDVPYDFKGIQFKRYAVTAQSTYTASIGQLNGMCIGCGVAPKGFTINSNTYDWYYTFTLVGNSLSGTKTDASLTKKAHDVTFSYYVQRNTLLNNVFIDGDAVETLHTQLGLTLSGADYDVVSANCTFSDATYNLTVIGDICNSDANETQVRNTLFVGSVRHNVFKSDFQDNTIVGDYIFNTSQLNDNIIFVKSGMARNIVEAMSENYIYVTGKVYYNKGIDISGNTVVITADETDALYGNDFGVQFKDNTISAPFCWNSCQYSFTNNTLNTKVLACTFNATQFRYNTVSTQVTACVFGGPNEYVDIPQVTSKYFAFNDVGEMRGASNAHIKLGYSGFFVSALTGTQRRVVIEGNDDGEIIATWRDADGKEAGVIATQAQSVAGTWNALPSPAGGTVTSVAMTVPTGFSVSGTPVTSSGTLAVTLDSQAKNKVLASPTNASGTPSFRALDASDIPDLSGTYKTTDANVTQTATTTNSNYEVLFSGSANNTTTTEGARKTSTLTYNPSTKALSTGGAVNGLTLTAATTGFTIAGGTTSKTLTVNNSYTLGAACAKAVTDNSSNADVTSSDMNLITGRTLYYQLAKKNYSTTSPGTLNTNNSTAQTASASEALSGTIKLHKVAKTGTYSDLIGTPSSLPASDVSAWAKAANKPSYTLDEVSDGSTRKLSDYLPLTGGTISTNSVYPLAVEDSRSNSTFTAIGFGRNGNNLGFLGFDGQDSPVYLSYTSANKYSLLHKGNFIAGTDYQTPIAANTYAPYNANGYLPLNGGTLTGNLTMGENTIVFNNSATSNWNSAQNSGLRLLNTIGTTTTGAPATYCCGLSINGYYGFQIASRSTLNEFKMRAGTGTDGTGYSSWVSLYHSGNANLSTINWACNNLTAAGTVTQGSDSRIKDNQQEISPNDAIAVIERLVPKTWTWNEKTGNAGKKAAGLVAQEVEEVIPDAVSITEEKDIKDFHTLNYNTVQGYEIAAIKGLIEEVESLKAEIAELKKQIK